MTERAVGPKLMEYLNGSFERVPMRQARQAVRDRRGLRLPRLRRRLRPSPGMNLTVDCGLTANWFILETLPGLNEAERVAGWRAIAVGDDALRAVVLPERGAELHVARPRPDGDRTCCSRRRGASRRRARRRARADGHASSSATRAAGRSSSPARTTLTTYGGADDPLPRRGGAAAVGRAKQRRRCAATAACAANARRSTSSGRMRHRRRPRPQREGDQQRRRGRPSSPGVTIASSARRSSSRLPARRPGCVRS